MSIRSRLVILPVAALILAGCAATEPDGPTGPTSGVVDIIDQPGSADGFVGAIEDAEITSCESDSSGWNAAGTVTNSADAAQSYRIYVSFMNQSDTAGLVQADVSSVAPGATEQWTASVELGGNDLECVLRVERFDPQG